MSDAQLKKLVQEEVKMALKELELPGGWTASTTKNVPDLGDVWASLQKIRSAQGQKAAQARLEKSGFTKVPDRFSWWERDGKEWELKFKMGRARGRPGSQFKAWTIEAADRGWHR